MNITNDRYIIMVIACRFNDIYTLPLEDLQKQADDMTDMELVNYLRKAITVYEDLHNEHTRGYTNGVTKLKDVIKTEDIHQIADVIRNNRIFKVQ